MPVSGQRIFTLFMLLSVAAGAFAENLTAEQTASVDGNYSHLLQTLHCPSDVNDNGDFLDYGYWSGGDWCGQTGVPGYWVWVNPNWYVWENSKYAENAGNGSSKPAIYNYDGGGGYVGGKKCSYVNAGGMSVRLCD